MPLQTYIDSPEIATQFSADGVRYGDLVFVTGCTSADAEGNIVGDHDLEGQTRQVYKKLCSVLEAAGTDFDGVLKTTVFLTDLEGCATVERVADELFGGTRPASTVVEVTALGRPEYLVEIDAIAAVRSSVDRRG